jgi:hypothetical protein
MSEDTNIEDAYVITDALPGASTTEEEPPQVEIKLEADPNNPVIVYGFAILVDEKGNMYLERDPKVFNLPVQRESTLVEVRRYAEDIVMDIQAQAAAEYTLARIKQDEQAKAAAKPEDTADSE